MRTSRPAGHTFDRTNDVGVSLLATPRDYVYQALLLCRGCAPQNFTFPYATAQLTASTPQLYGGLVQGMNEKGEGGRRNMGGDRSVDRRRGTRPALPPCQRAALLVAATTAAQEQHLRSQHVPLPLLLCHPAAGLALGGHTSDFNMYAEYAYQPGGPGFAISWPDLMPYLLGNFATVAEVAEFLDPQVW